MRIININAETSDAELNNCVELLMKQMDFINSPSSAEKVKEGLDLAIKTPQITKVFAAQKTDNEIVGILFGNKGTSIEKAGYYFWLNELYIKDEERGKGIGTQLLTALINWCEIENINGITLCASLENGKAKRLYQKMDFDFEAVNLFNKIL